MTRTRGSPIVPRVLSRGRGRALAGLSRSARFVTRSMSRGRPRLARNPLPRATRGTSPPPCRSSSPPSLEGSEHPVFHGHHEGRLLHVVLRGERERSERRREIADRLQLSLH